MVNRTYHPRGKLIDGYSARSHPLYNTWSNMLARCTLKTSPQYANYGGRGIEVCARWHHFENFVADMGMKPAPTLTLNRIDNDGDYTPENCEWSSRSDQCVNRRKFVNNSTGHRGVVQISARFSARFDYEGVRYKLGNFSSKAAAGIVAERFRELFFSDRPAAMQMLPKDTARCTSKTGIRGVNPHPDGGFVVRLSVEGVRHYLGYFKTLDEAKDARARFVAQRTR